MNELNNDLYMKEYLKNEKRFLIALQKTQENCKKVLDMRHDNFEDEDLRNLELLYVNFYNTMKLIHTNIYSVLLHPCFEAIDNAMSPELANIIIFDMACFMDYKLNSYIFGYEQLKIKNVCDDEKGDDNCE